MLRTPSQPEMVMRVRTVHANTSVAYTKSMITRNAVQDAFQRVEELLNEFQELQYALNTTARSEQMKAKHRKTKEIV